jgi:hypothetical protein
MLTPKARAQLRRDYTQAQKHLAFLERCADIPKDQRPLGILMATPDMIMVARQKVADLERRLLENAEQLDLFT